MCVYVILYSLHTCSQMPLTTLKMQFHTILNQTTPCAHMKSFPFLSLPPCCYPDRHFQSSSQQVPKCTDLTKIPGWKKQQQQKTVTDIKFVIFSPQSLLRKDLTHSPQALTSLLSLHPLQL